MKIVCLIKFVPDAEGPQLVLNPDDACALAQALLIKRNVPDTVIEVVTMAPGTVTGQLEDLLRRNIDRVTLLSDRRFSGSDTLATTRVLARYLETAKFDLMLTGTRSLDGDTSHVPSQLAEGLGLPQLSHVLAVDLSSLRQGKPVVEMDTEAEILSFVVELPAILSLTRECGLQLPYVAFQDLGKDVSAQLRVLSNEELHLDDSEMGLDGSLTQVRRTFAAHGKNEQQVVVNNDSGGIEVVYGYLKKGGFLP